MHNWTGWMIGAALIGLAACGQTSGSAEAEGPGAEAPSADAAPTDAAHAPGGPATGTAGALEVGFDRPGYDHRTEYGTADAEACRDLCQADAECLSFTWVQAGIQAETPICWLKDQVPGQVEAEWATSGVMVGREAPAGE